MTDDLVTRLRADCDGDCKYATANAFVPCDKCGAANEIERLRADRDRWRFAAEAVWYANDPTTLAEARRLYEMAEVRSGDR